ncbi:MAG: HIT domain-containing protein [Candidatus Woesearchaeota archaeon]
MDLSNLSPEEIIELQKKNCIFCKIIKREIPSYEIYRDDKVIVILDINPANEGHCLILPIQHYQILPQIPENIISHMAIIAKRTSKLMLKSLGIKGTSVFIANGAIAGQKSPHFMIHLIPRKPNDMLFQLNKKNVDIKKLEEIKTKLFVKMSQLSGKQIQIEHNSEENENSKESIKDNDKESSVQKNNVRNEKIDIDKISKLFGQ